MARKKNSIKNATIICRDIPIGLIWDSEKYFKAGWKPKSIAYWAKKKQMCMLMTKK